MTLDYWLGFASPFIFVATVFVVWVAWLFFFCKKNVGHGVCDHCDNAGLASCQFEIGTKTPFQVLLYDIRHEFHARFNTTHRVSWQEWYDRVNEGLNIDKRWPKAQKRYGTSK